MKGSHHAITSPPPPNAAAIVKAVTPHPKQHTTQSDFWEAVRIKPVKVTSVDGATVYWSFQDTHELKLGSVVTDEHTKFPPGSKRAKPTSSFTATRTRSPTS